LLLKRSMNYSMNVNDASKGPFCWGQLVIFYEH
jgi:hypothetical protein